MSDQTIKVGVTAKTADFDNAMKSTAVAVESSMAKVRESIFTVSESIKSKMVGVQDSIKQTMEETRQSVDKTHTSIKLLAGVAIAGLVGEKMFELAKSAAEYADQIARASQRTGIATSALQEIAFAAQMSDVSFESLTSALTRLSVKMQEAKSGTGATAEAFKAVGISAGELSNLKVDDVLLRIADKFHNSEDGASKAAVAVALFGRAGAELIPLLNQGADGLEELRNRAKELGVVMSEDGVKAGAALDDQIKELQLSTQGLKNRISQTLVPAFLQVTEAMTQFASDASGANGAVVGIDQMMKFFAVTMSYVAEMFESTGVTIGGDLATIQILLTQGVTAAREQMKLMDADLAAISKRYDDFRTNIDKPISAPQKTENQDHHSDSINFDPNAGSGSKKSDSEKEAEKAARAAEKRRQQEMQAEIALAGGKRQIAIAEIAQKQADAQLEQQMGLISKEQLLQQELQFTEQKKAIQMAALQDQLGVLEKDPNTNPLEFARVKAQMLQEEARYQIQLAQLRTQLTLEQNSPALNIMDSMTSSMETAMTNMLMMTQNWKQSLVNIYNQVARSFVTELISKQVAEWVKSKMTMLAMEAGFITKETALKAVGATQGASVTAAGATAEVTSKAASGAAGAFSAMASIPYVGPALGFAAMAAAMAGVMALVGNIKSASGGYDIPSGVNPITQLHQEEMVLPAQYANVIRKMAAGGQGGASEQPISITMHVNATDADSFRASQRQIDADLSHTMRHARRGV